jgi:phage/plasmid-like protein (TIGR03299 family)
MAHEFETGFFVTEPAWHGLGTVLQDPPTIAEALTAAGLDWTVELQKLTRPDGQEVPSRAVVRSLDQSLLGVVGPDYTPIQNSEALRCFQPLVDSGAVRLEAAGSLREGKRVWMLGQVLGSQTSVIKHDPVSQYVLFANAHDGTMSVHYGFTGVRVVCQNTLTAALSGGSKLLRIRHTQGAPEALTAATAILDAARGEFAGTIKQLQFLASKGCDEATLKRYVREVFAIRPDQIVSIEPETDEPKLCSRIVSKVVELAEAGRGTDVAGVRGTLWGAYNAITEYITHERGTSQNIRVDSQWFGPGAQLAARALKVGLQLAQAA